MEHKDVFRYLGKSSDESFDIIFVDPPFTEHLADDVMKAISATSLLSEEGMLFIESTKHEVLLESYGLLKLHSQKNFGDKFLSRFENF